MTSFEIQTCGRCGGSGHYSYCQMHGTTCFGCGGKGKVLSKRGRAAKARFMDLTTKAVADLRPGDYLLENGKWKRILSVGESDGCKYLDQPTGEWKAYTEIKTTGIGLNTFADAKVRAVSNDEELQAAKAAALEYQGTLTQAWKGKEEPDGAAN